MFAVQGGYNTCTVCQIIPIKPTVKPVSIDHCDWRTAWYYRPLRQARTVSHSYTVVRCKPLTKDHLPLKTVFSGPKGWSLVTGFTVSPYPRIVDNGDVKAGHREVPGVLLLQKLWTFEPYRLENAVWRLLRNKTILRLSTR